MKEGRVQRESDSQISGERAARPRLLLPSRYLQSTDGLSENSQPREERDGPGCALPAGRPQAGLQPPLEPGKSSLLPFL